MLAKIKRKKRERKWTNIQIENCVACLVKWPKKQSNCTICTLNVIPSYVFNWIFQVNVWCGHMNVCTNCICHVTHYFVTVYHVHTVLTHEKEENKRIIVFIISRIVSKWVSKKERVNEWVSSNFSIICFVVRV